MATTYTSLAKGQFKTAYLQREQFLPFTPAATETAHVGDICYVNSDGKLTRVSSTESTADAAKQACIAQVAAGYYIIAQSDQTVGYGHVPVENRDYRYSDEVALTQNVEKTIAVFKITDLDDVVITTVDSVTVA